MATILARLTCDEPTARRLAASFDEALGNDLGDDVVVAAFEGDDNRWVVELTFAAPPDEAAIRALAARGGGDPAGLTFSTVEEQDWVAASLAGLRPVRAGRFVVHGAHHRGTFAPNLIGIEIEAALAFGTGHHGTTRGCLLALDRWAKAARRNRRVLDVGTGTGVLAIAAAKALRRRIAATDIDPVAVRIARVNANHNAAAPLIATRVADGCRAMPNFDYWRGPFDLILANILLGPLTRMAPQLARRLTRGGRIVLSGLLPAQANAACAAYRAQGLALERRTTLENWVTLVMRRGRK